MPKQTEGEPRGKGGRREVLTSLNKVQSRVVRVDVNLPPFVGEIGVNVRALEKICRIAGIGSLRITTRPDDDISSTQNTFVGVNRDGTAIQAQVAVKTIVPEAKSELLPPDKSLYRRFLGSLFFDYRAAAWANVRMELNTAEIANRIRDERSVRRGVADTRAWARHMNDAIIGEVDRRGTYQLTRGGSSNNDVWTGFSTFLGILQGFNVDPFTLIEGDSALYHPHMLHGINDGIYIVMAVVLENITGYLSYVFGFATNKDEEHPLRLSVLGPNAPELDRVAILKVLRKFRHQFPIVKVMPQYTVPQNSDH